MTDFERIASTTRNGITVDEVSFDVPGDQRASGYLLGRRFDGPQPLALGLHHGRGDKSTLLHDVETLAARGFLCLSVDSPVSRRAFAARDPLTAFTSQFSIALAALNLLHRDPEVRSDRTALVGRGLGGEVAAHLAAQTGRIHTVVAIDSLPERSRFLAASPHPLAAGLRLFLDDESQAQQVNGLESKRLVDQLEQARDTHWLLQVAEDDDRLSDKDRSTLLLSIPRTVRVEYVAHARDLSARHARRTRIDFISQMCG